MNLFRSEEHVQAWLDGLEADLQASPAKPVARGENRGATISIVKLAELAWAWWHDRLSPDWRPHTRDQNQAILDGLGLTGPFWQLP